MLCNAADCRYRSSSPIKGPATRNDFVNDIVNDARADAIFATLKAIVNDEKSTISSTISLRVAWPLHSGENNVSSSRMGIAL